MDTDKAKLGIQWAVQAIKLIILLLLDIMLFWGFRLGGFEFYTSSYCAHMRNRACYVASTAQSALLGDMTGLEKTFTALR